MDFCYNHPAIPASGHISLHSTDFDGDDEVSIAHIHLCSHCLTYANNTRFSDLETHLAYIIPTQPIPEPV